MNVQTIVARNLRKIRVKRGISQENLAVDAQIDRTYVSRLERGLENPTVVVLDRLAVALDVKVQDFFAAVSSQEKPVAPLSGGRKRT